MGYRDFARDAIIIASAQFLTAIMAFLLLPVVTKNLGLHNYGIWAQFSVTISLLTPTILLGLNIAMLRLMSARTDKAELREGFYSVLFFVAMVGAVVVLILVAASGPIAATVFKDPGLSGLVMLVPLIVTVSALAQISLYFFRVLQRIRAFAFFSVVKAAGELASILVLLSYGLELEGVMVGLLIADAFVMVSALAYVVYLIGFSMPRFTTMRESLSFGLPLTPFALLSWVINLSYPYFIGFFLGLSFVGSYSAAYSIGGTIYLLASPIQLALLPTVSRLYDGHDMEGVRFHLSQSLRHFLILAIPAFIGLSVLSPVLVQTLTTPDFVAGSTVLPYIALSGVLGGISTIEGNILYLEKKPHLDMGIHIVAAAIVIALDVLLIPTVGIVGAALANLASYAGMVAITHYYCTRYLRFSVDWRSVAKSGAAALAMSGVIILLDPQTLVQIVEVIVLAIMVYFIVLIAIGGINVQERTVLREAVDKVRFMMDRRL